MFWKGLMLLGGFLSVGWQFVMSAVFVAVMYVPYIHRKELAGEQVNLAPLNVAFLLTSPVFLQIGLAATIITLFPIVARKFN